jgi:hypothetical protein
MLPFDDFEAQVKTLFKGIVDRRPFAKNTGDLFRADLPQDSDLWAVTVYYENRKQRWSINTVHLSVWGVGTTLLDAYEDFRRQLVLSRNRLCERHDRLLEVLT